MKSKYVKYIEEAYKIVVENSLYSHKLDKELLLSNALSKVNIPNSYEECFPAVEEMMVQLNKVGDIHSKFKPFIKKKALKKNKVIDKIPSSYIQNEIGIIKITTFTSYKEDKAIEYAKHCQSILKSFNKKMIKGIIVDLRGNKGGNMDGMIAGLGPLFSTKLLGSFVYNNGLKDTWGYKDGNYLYNDEVIFTIEDPVILKDNYKIAIIINNDVVSSAEILLISFLGQDNVKVFGRKTRGLTTANIVYRLEDKSRLVLAVATEVDRNGIIYEGSIEPHKYCSEEKVVESAIGWIKTNKN